jgi:hypothetical protein
MLYIAEPFFPSNSLYRYACAVFTTHHLETIPCMAFRLDLDAAPTATTTTITIQDDDDDGSDRILRVIVDETHATILVFSF